MKTAEMGLIPHQIGLARPQMGKLMRGLPVQISHAQMGSGAGDIVMMLHPHNAKKLLGSYKKGKGVRIAMSPEEIHHTIHHGRGFFDWAKKAVRSVGNVVGKALDIPVVREVAKKGVHYGADVLGTAVGTYLGNPVAGAMIGEAVGSAAEHALDKKDVRAGASHLAGTAQTKGKKIALQEVEKQVRKLPESYRGVAQQALHSAINDIEIDDAGVSHLVDAGYGVKRRGRPRKGAGVIEDAVKGVRRITGLGARPPKGSPEMKAYMAKIRGMRKGKGILDDIGRAFDPRKNGVAKAFEPVQHFAEKTFTPKLGREITSGLIHQALPAVVSGLAGSATTALTGNPYAGFVAGQTLGKIAGKEAGDAVGKASGYGIKRGRGRPRKGCGASASMSKPFKQALALNKMTYGLNLNNTSDNNAPISKFHTDPRVKPSSTEMTLSPYQSINSPAMNPFIPTSYQQEGGESCGYGHAVPYTNIYGQGVKRRGKGLYGGGLYGGGLF
jgi:hypothetical protein